MIDWIRFDADTQRCRPSLVQKVLKYTAGLAKH